AWQYSILGCSDGECQVRQFGSADPVDADLAKQVGPQSAAEAVAVLVIHRQAVKHTDSLLLTQRFKVAEGAEVDVRSVVPRVGQKLGHRHPPTAGQVPAAAPVAKVGEGDDALAADPQHFLEDPVRVLDRLQRLG